MPRRLRNGLAAGFNATSDVFGTLVRSALQQQISNEAAARNDLLERGRTADQLIAQGKIEPEDRAAFISGKYAGPSAERQLGDIIGGISKAPTMQEVPSREALGADFRAKRLPLVGFGKTELPSIDGNLPSTQFAPVESAPFAETLNARSAKLQSFPPTKTGEVWTGEGASLRPFDIYSRFNPDTNSLEEINRVSAGPTAGQKGSFEGQTAAETARQVGPVNTANKLAEQTALMPGAVKQTGLEASARGAADTQTAVNRAKLTGGLLPEQTNEANTLRDDFQNQSKEFWVQQDSFRRMAAQAQNPSAAGDLGMIFGYMKMLDPNSSVREGEQATAQNAAGVGDRFRNLYNRLLTGERLTQEQRNDFLGQARNIYQSATAEHQKRVKDFATIAAQHNIPANEVIREPAAGLNFVGETRTLPDGRTVTVVGVNPDGTLQVR